MRRFLSRIAAPFRRRVEVIHAVATPHWVPAGSEDVAARYEAARNGIDRSWLPGYVQGARQDMNSAERLEILRKYRYHEKNNAFVQKVLDLIETNTVGSGIHPIPSTSNERLNAAILRYWNSRCEHLAIDSGASFWAMQPIIARAEFGDGEIFSTLLRTAENEPKVQLVETQRVMSARIPKETAPGLSDLDGILVDKRGTPRAYVVANDSDLFEQRQPTSVTIFPAEQVVHFFNPSRAGQYRGISNFHAVLHTLHDLDDLQRYEMLAAKDAAHRANVITTEDGEIPVERGPIGRGLKKATPATSVSDLASRADELSVAFGGKTVALKKGETWEQSKSERPSPAMRDFWAYLEATGCKGVGISYAAYCDYSGNWGGAALRAAVVSDNRFYSNRSDLYSQGFQKIYEHVVDAGFENGDIIDAETGEVFQKPADWNCAVWQPPRRGSVDIGRDTSAMLAEITAGTRTYRDVIGESGGDWKDYFTQRAAEEAFLDSLAKKAGIPVSRIASMSSNERAQALTASSSAPVAAPTDAAETGDAGESDAERPAEAGSQAEAAQAGDVQSAAMNGAQVQALVDLANKVAAGELPAASARAIASASFPLIPAEQIAAIFDGLTGFTPASKAEPVTSTTPAQ